MADSAHALDISAPDRAARQAPAAPVSIEDFCVDPRRSRLTRSFRNFPDAEVEDALSFAIEQGLRGLCRGTSEPEVFSWLRTVMLRRLGRERLRQGRVVTASGEGVRIELVPSAAPTPEEALLDKERCEAVAEFVDGLSSGTRAVLHARYFENLERAEVARATGMTERQVKRHLERGMDAVESFVVDRLAGPNPCAAGRDSVTRYARGVARGAVADRAKTHMTSCQRCRDFYGEFRAVRWGAAAVAPVPAVIGDGSQAAGVVEKLSAAVDWTKQQFFAVAGRADPTPVGAMRGPGAAATLLTCAAIGTAGSATYCVTQGVPEPVRELVGAGETDAKKPQPVKESDGDVPTPLADEAPLAPQTAPAPAPVPDAQPVPEPEVAPEPREQEFSFERSGPAGAAASSTQPEASSQPAKPARAPAEGGGEFGP